MSGKKDTGKTEKGRKRELERERLLSKGTL